MQGDAQVKVEHRSRAEDSFGKGKKIDMTFASFLKELEAGNENLYLTTQEVVIRLPVHHKLEMSADYLALTV